MNDHQRFDPGPVPADPRSVVLVEGASDRSALEALAERRGRHLVDEGISIVPTGGGTNFKRFLDQWGPSGVGVKVAGLCDAGEERDVQRGLELAGFGTDLTRDDMERLGFYVCVLDLEDELIRALGVDAVEEVVVAAGELGKLRTFQGQSAWQDRPPDEQLRRFMGTTSGRKVRYGRLLVEALDPDQVPRPLDLVLANV